MSSARTFIGVALLLAVTAPASAQSLFSTRGLGIPVRAVDARTATLGGIGVGLIGFHTSMTNPAELIGITRRGVSAALQPVSTTSEAAGVEDNTSGSRFPLLSILYPFSPRFVASASYGAYLEQSWGIMTESTVVLDGESYEVIDLLRSSGGVAHARVAAAYAVTPAFSVGASAGLLTGSVERSARRAFTDSSGLGFRPLTDVYRWSYQAPVASVGMRLDLAGRVRLGASALVGGNLKATGQTESADDREYGAPLELSAGASARLSSLLLATGGAVWSRLPATDGDEVSTETIRVGGGLEYQGLRSGQRTFPIRLGGHWTELPYSRTGEDAATEWGVAGGLGFRLGDPTDPAALLDLGIERGSRSGLAGGALSDGLTENLWRMSLSLSLFAR